MKHRFDETTIPYHLVPSEIEEISVSVRWTDGLLHVDLEIYEQSIRDEISELEPLLRLWRSGKFDDLHPDK